MRKITLLFLFSAALISCNNFGNKITSGHVEIYYQDKIEKSEAEKTASVLMNLEESAGRSKEVTKSFQLSQPKDTVLLKMVADEKRATEMPDIAFQAIATIVSDSAFNGKPINIELTDNKFKTFKHLAFKKITDDMAIDDYGKKYTSGNVELYVKDNLSDTEATELAAFLNDLMKPGQMISFQSLQNDKNVFTLRMASDKEKVTGLSDDNFQEVANSISENGMKGKPVIYELATTDFVPFRSFPSKK